MAAIGFHSDQCVPSGLFMKLRIRCARVLGSFRTRLSYVVKKTNIPFFGTLKT